MISSREYFFFTLLVVGAVIMHFYFYNVDLSPQPIYVLYLGVALQATSAAAVFLDLLKKENSEISLSFYSLYVFSFAFSQAAINLTRFFILPGTDLLAEVQVGQATFDMNRWDLSLTNTNRYASSLAVTILPSVFAGVTGISDIYHVFGILNSFFAALIPVTLVLLVSRLFGGVKIAIFSSILLAQNYFFYYSVNLIMKTTFAVTFLILGILCCTYKNRGYKVLGAIFLLLVAPMHYTIAMMALFFLVSVFFFGRLMKEPESAGSFIPASVLGVAAAGWIGWIVLLSKPALGSIGYLLTSLGRRVSEFSTPSSADSSSILKGAETGYVLSPPIDPISTAYFYTQTALTLLGAAILVAEVIQSRAGRRRLTYLPTMLSSKVKTWRHPNAGTAAYILAGFGWLGLSAAWIALPFFSSQLSTFRVLGFGLMIAPFFMAVPLYRFLRSLVVLKAIAFIVLVLMLPMNMLMTSHERSVLYHPIEYLEPARQLDMMSTLYPTSYDLQLAGWLSNHFPGGAQIRTDGLGRYVMRTLLPVNATVSWVQTYTPQGWTTYRDPSRYFLLNEISVGQGIWAMARLRGIEFIPLDFSPFFGVGQNLIYNSEGFYLLNHA